MATYSRKLAFGGLLFVSATVILWMHYSSSSAGSTPRFSGNEAKLRNLEPKANKKFAQVQLELLETLTKQEILVTSEDSSDYSSESDVIEQIDVKKMAVKDVPSRPDISMFSEDRGNEEGVDESSASDSGFSETDKWPWTRDANVTTVDTNTRTKNQTLSRKLKKLINCYEWNDRDPDAWRVLPLKSEKDDSQRGERVIFNRVGKCGSRTVIILLRQLAAENNFHMISSLVYNSTVIDEEWQARLVHDLDQVQTPYLFQRHLHYVDFTRFGSTKPVYINIIRDPLARMVSQYYFRRFGDGRGKERFSGSPEEKYQTFDECVLQRKDECLGKRSFYIIPFFCGQEKKCKSSSEWSLDMAIRNVEEKYLFVGILEEFEDSLAVLERLLPSMFRKAVYFYKNPTEEKEKIDNTSTLHKKKPSPAVEQIMRANMQYEYQFYNFVKNKFHKTRDMLGIQPST